MYTSHVCTMYDVLCTLYRTCPSYAIIITQTNNLRKLFSYIKKTIRKNSVSRSCGSWKTDRNVFKNQPPHLLRYLFSDNTVHVSYHNHKTTITGTAGLVTLCLLGVLSRWETYKIIWLSKDHMTFKRSYDFPKIIWHSKDHMTFKRSYDIQKIIWLSKELLLWILSNNYFEFFCFFKKHLFKKTGSCLNLHELMIYTTLFLEHILLRHSA